MSAIKEQVVEMIRNLPDDVTLEDIKYHLYVLEKIEEGRISAETERTYTQEEARQRLARWLPK
ncbi:hypothetical protein HS125_03265 [bacterium]|nr:hypothetical protein [bacterium]